MIDRGFWNVSGPYPYDVRPSRRYRAEYIPHGKPPFDAGTGWGRTEKEARDKARRRARLRNRTRTLR